MSIEEEGPSSDWDFRGDPAKHVYVSHDLSIVRGVEVEGRTAGHVPKCNLSQGKDTRPSMEGSSILKRPDS
jgi:hypothetical protein